MKFYRLLTFVLILSGYNTQAQTDTTKIQENLNENGITDTTKAPVYNLDKNGIIDFWKRNTIGHEVNTVGEEGLLKKDESTFQSLLSGRVAGVTVVPGQAGIGSSTEIYIRGYHILNGSQQPLYIVDGIPYNNQTISWNPNTNQYRIYPDVKIDVGSRIADISIFDIESIEVVQNSSALAIYGSQAANGAILITTKKGKFGSKFNVSFSTGLTAERPLVLPKFQNAYGDGAYGVFDAPYLGCWGPKFNGQFFIQFDTPAYGWVNGQLTVVRHGDTEAVKKAKDLGYSTDLFGTEYIPYPNNVKGFFETAMSNANNVAISGSSERWNYRLSISNHDLNGIVPNSGINKNNVAFNFAVAPLKFLTISSSFGYSASSGTVAHSGIMRILTVMGREINIANLKEYRQRGDVDAEFRVSNREENPYKLAYYSYNKQTNDAFNGNALFDFKLLKNWHLNYQLALDNSNSNLYNNYFDSPQKETAEDDYKYRSTNHTVFTTIALHPITAIEINGLIGISKNKRYTKYNKSEEAVIYSWGDYDIENTAFFTQLNFKLLETYFFELQGRKEKEKSQETFEYTCYSFSTGVTFKKYLKPTDFVSNAIVRASLGQTVREKGSINGYPSYFPPVNSEETTSELGLEFEFLGNHKLAATFYKVKSLIMPFNTRLGDNTIDDFGELSSHGINISATSRLISTSNSSLFLNISFERSICELTKLSDEIAYMKVGNLIYKEGEQYPQLGYNVPMQHNGKIVYNAYNNPMEDYTSTEPNISNQTPDFTINVAPTYHYKKLSVSILCSWQKGGKILSNTIKKGSIYGTLKETDNREELVTIDGYTYDSQTDTYTPYSANITKEVYMTGKYMYDGRNSIVDASFFKIREASVSYTFDSPNKRYFQNISVSLIGRNLLLLAKQDHFDPETAFLGEENFAIPTTRSFSLQLTATF